MAHPETVFFAHGGLSYEIRREENRVVVRGRSVESGSELVVRGCSPRTGHDDARNGDPLPGGADEMPADVDSLPDGSNGLPCHVDAMSSHGHAVPHDYDEVPDRCNPVSRY